MLSPGVAQGSPLSPWNGQAACHAFLFYKLTEVMIRKGFAANMEIYRPAGLESEFQLHILTAEGSCSFGI